jgi:hypothetical protein
VIPAQTTMYVVTGVNPPANCSSSRSITVNVDACLGVEEQNAHRKSVAYPNPVSHELVLENDEESMVDVYNELGMLLMQKHMKAGKEAINTENWTSGIFFVRVSGKNGSQVFRIIKTE